MVERRRRGMPTSPLGSTHGRTTSGVDASIAFGKHTRSKDVERVMTSPPLDSAHGRTTSGATCHHRLWKAHTVERSRAWHAIITFGQHTRLNYVGRVMPSSPLYIEYGQTTSGVACIIAFGQHTRSNDVGRDKTSWFLDSTQGRTTSGVAYIIAFGLADTVGRRKAWHNIIALGRETQSNDVERGMPSPPWDSTHGHTTSGVACHNRLMAAHTVERRQAWHDITSFGQHTRSNDVGRGMPSSPLGSTHNRTTSGGACNNSPWTANTVERRQA